MMAVCYDLSENYELVKVPRLLEAFLKQFWLAVDSSGKQVVLLVDRADELPKQTLPDLRKMFTLADSSRLTVVLLSESGRRNPV
jgi:type II secretory pathway predicted ATPase ExeA